MQPLCNYVSTHVQSREKRGFGERETQYLAKSIGKSAQVINPGRGHLTDLVEAMPFNPGYILSPRGEYRKGLSPQNLMTLTTLVSSEVSLPLQGYTQSISVLSRELKSQSLSPRRYGDSTGLVTEEPPKLHSLCSYLQPQLNNSILNSQ